MVAFHQRIYRGEMRRAYPTWRNPDPVRHAAEDPEGFLKTWMSPTYPYPEGYTGIKALSVGQHWTRSPEIIPERFSVEHLLHDPQPGVPMGKPEQTALSRREFVDTAHLTEPKYPEHPEYHDFPKYPGRDAPEEEHEAYRQFSESYGQKMDAHYAAVADVERQRKEHWATSRKYETYLDRASREGRNTYADLSDYGEKRPGQARQYNMAIVWEAQHPEAHEFERGTNYEDELDLPFGSHVNVTGARLHIPRPGEIPDLTKRHPSPFTPEEHRAASLDAHLRSTYSHISPEASVSWSRVQFANAQQVPVERGNISWGR